MQGIAAQMGIDFCGGDTGMAEDLLQGPDIHLAVLVHQGGSGMTQLVDRITARIKAGSQQIVFQKQLDCFCTDPPAQAADKQGFGIAQIAAWADSQIFIEGGNTGSIQVDGPFLAPFA